MDGAAMVLTLTTRVSRVILAYGGGAPPASFSVPGDMHGGSVRDGSSFAIAFKAQF